MNTKQNPGCYHSALNYLAALTGKPKTKLIYFDKIEHLRTKPHRFRNQATKFKSKLLYKADKITVETECGKSLSWFPLLNKRFDDLGYVAKRFAVEVNKKLNEFGVELTLVGTYKDCLGNGWTSDVDLYMHNGNYFATNMECKCF